MFLVDGADNFGEASGALWVQISPGLRQAKVTYRSHPVTQPALLFAVYSMPPGANRLPFPQLAHLQSCAVPVPQRRTSRPTSCERRPSTCGGCLLCPVTRRPPSELLQPPGLIGAKKPQDQHKPVRRCADTAGIMPGLFPSAEQVHSTGRLMSALLRGLHMGRQPGAYERPLCPQPRHCAGHIRSQRPSFTCLIEYDGASAHQNCPLLKR